MIYQSCQLHLYCNRSFWHPGSFSLYNVLTPLCCYVYCMHAQGCVSCIIMVMLRLRTQVYVCYELTLHQLTHQCSCYSTDMVLMILSHGLAVNFYITQCRKLQGQKHSEYFELYIELAVEHIFTSKMRQLLFIIQRSIQCIQ